MTIRLHLLRLWRSRRPHLAVVFLAFYLGLTLLGFYAYAMAETGGAVELGYSLANDAYFNGFTFALYAFHFGIVLVLPVFAATEGGAQVAAETASGQMFLFLTRPLARWRLFLGKALVASGYCVALVTVLLLLALGVGLLAAGWGDLELRAGALRLVDETERLEFKTALARFALVLPAAWLAVLAPLAMSFLVASWTRSSLNAVGVSVSLYLVLHAIGEVPFFIDLRPWLFTSYMTFWSGLLHEAIAWREVLLNAAKLAGFSTLFALLAFRRFRLREER